MSHTGSGPPGATAPPAAEPVAPAPFPSSTADGGSPKTAIAVRTTSSGVVAGDTEATDPLGAATEAAVAEAAVVPAVAGDRTADAGAPTLTMGVSGRQPPRATNSPVTTAVTVSARRTLEATGNRSRRTASAVPARRTARVARGTYRPRRYGTHGAAYASGATGSPTSSANRVSPATP